MFKRDSKLERRIRRAKVVSFDVFDTSILRQLDEPRSLFQLMLPRITGILGDRTSDFPGARAYAEETARIRVLKAGKYEEVSLHDIYAVVADIFGLDGAATQELCQHEIQAELAVCRQNPFIHSVYRHCLDNGKTIAFLSDMYLPQRAVAEILEKCGYSEYAALLVSSESRTAKHSGKLYDEALERIGVAPGRWLHIGDNFYSDIRRARRRGLMTWHYASAAERLRRDHRQHEAWRSDRPSSPGRYVVKGLIANRLARPAPIAQASKPADRFWEDLGYCTAGPLYVGLTEWLLGQIADYNPQAVYFLARDGFIVQRMFEMLRPASLAHIETHYLYTSRRAAQFATIRSIDSDTLDFLAQCYGEHEVSVVLERIGLDPKQYEAAVRNAGFRSADQRVHTNSRNHERLKRLILSLAKPICDRAGAEREVMLDYLLASGLTDGRRIAVVDIGWRGNSHRSIQEMLQQNGHSVQIKGYYLGTVAFDANIDLRLSQEAYLFRFGHPNEYRSVLHSCVEVVELLFSSAEGSLIHMARTPYGGFAPVQQARTPEEVARGEIVERIQAGGTQFVTDYVALKQEFAGLALTREDAVNQLRRVLQQPTREEAARLGDVPHTRDFGNSTSGVISPRPRLHWLLRGRRQIRWREGPWRAGVRARSSWLYRLLHRLRMRDLGDL